MTKITLQLPRKPISEFCQRWQISELAVFGSVLREDFSARSDVDVMVTFEEGAEWSLIDHIKMEEELEQILDRQVDLVTKKGVEQSKNWIRREAILNSAQVVYAAG